MVWQSMVEYGPLLELDLTATAAGANKFLVKTFVCLPAALLIVK